MEKLCWWLFSVSASIGLARSLKTGYGVASVIGNGGYFDGHCSGRFILAMIISGLVLLTKGFMIGQAFDLVN